ncbi:MAG: hypothetical protein WDW36_006417 [Sanguina aurantia]
MIGHSPAPPSVAPGGRPRPQREQQGLLQTLSKVEQQSEDRAFEIIKLRTLVLRIEKEREDARATARQLTEHCTELKHGFAAAAEELQALHKEHNELRCKQWNESPTTGLHRSLSGQLLLPQARSPSGPGNPSITTSTPFAHPTLQAINTGSSTPRKLQPLFLPTPASSPPLPSSTPPTESKQTSDETIKDQLNEAPAGPISRLDLDAIAEEEGLQVSLDSQPLTPTAYAKGSGAEPQRTYSAGLNHTTHILITAPKRGDARSALSSRGSGGGGAAALAAACVQGGLSPLHEAARAAVEAVALAAATAGRRCGGALASPAAGSGRPTSCYGGRRGEEARFSGGGPASDIGQQMLIAQLVDFRQRVLFLEGEVATLTEANVASISGRTELEERLAGMLAEAAPAAAAAVAAAAAALAAAVDCGSSGGGGGSLRTSFSGNGRRSSPAGPSISRTNSQSDTHRRSIGGPLGRSESRRSKDGVNTANNNNHTNNPMSDSLDAARTSLTQLGGIGSLSFSVATADAAGAAAAAAALRLQISALLAERETSAMLRAVEADVLRGQLEAAGKAVLLAQQPLQAQLAALRLQLSEAERQRAELLEEQHGRSSALSEALAVKAELTEKLAALHRSEEISATALHTLEAQLCQAHDAALQLEAHASLLEAALFDAESSLTSTRRQQHASSSAALDGAQLPLARGGGLDGSGGGLDLEHSNLDPDLVGSAAAHQTLLLLLTGLQLRHSACEPCRESSEQVLASGTRLREQTGAVAKLSEALRLQAAAAEAAEAALRERIRECEAQLFCSCQKAAEMATQVARLEASSAGAASKAELQGVFKKLKGVAAAYRLNLAGPLSAQLKSDSSAVTEQQRLPRPPQPRPPPPPRRPSQPRLDPERLSRGHQRQPPGRHRRPHASLPPGATAATAAASSLGALARTFRHHRSSSSGYNGFADLLPMLGGSGSTSRRVSLAGIPSLPALGPFPAPPHPAPQSLISAAVGKAMGGAASTNNRSGSPVPGDEGASTTSLSSAVSAHSAGSAPAPRGAGPSTLPALLPSLSFSSAHTPPRHKRSSSALDGSSPGLTVPAETGKADSAGTVSAASAPTAQSPLDATHRVVLPIPPQVVHSGSGSRPGSAASVRSRPGSGSSNHPTSQSSGASNVTALIAGGRKGSDEVLPSGEGGTGSGSSVPHLPSLARSSLAVSSGPGL